MNVSSKFCGLVGAVGVLAAGAAAAEPVWVQVVAFAPGENDYTHGYAGWVRLADLGERQAGEEHTFEELLLTARPGGPAWSVTTFTIRCGRSEIRLLGQTGYAADGSKLSTAPGDDRFDHIYPHSAEADLNRAICQGWTPSNPATAGSVAEAVARGVPKPAGG